MISKDEFLKRIKFVFRFGTNPSKRKLLSPERDWLLGLLVSSIFLAVTVVWSIKTYSSYLNVFDREPEAEIEVGGFYQDHLVKGVLYEYEQREKILESKKRLFNNNPVKQSEEILLPDEKTVNSDVVSSSSGTTTETVNDNTETPLLSEDRSASTSEANSVDYDNDTTGPVEGDTVLPPSSADQNSSTPELSDG